MTNFFDVTFVGFNSLTIQELYRMLCQKITKFKQPWQGFVACESGKNLHLINVFTGRVIHKRGSTFAVIDDKRVAYTNDNIITIYSVDTWQPLFSLPKIDSTANYNVIYSLRMLRNGYLASGGFDSCVTIWNIDTKEKIQVWALPSGSVFDICELQNGSLAVSTYNAVYIWNPNTGEKLHTLTTISGHAYTLTELSGNLLCVGANNVTIWNTQTGQLVKELLNTDDACDNSVSACDDNTIICGNSKGYYYHWTVNGDVIFSTNFTAIHCIQYVGHKRVLLADGDNIILWDMVKNESINTIESEQNIYHLKLIR